MRLLADMNVSPMTVARLRDGGYDAIRVSEVMAASTPDALVLEWAREHDYVLLTNDLDFSALVALGGNHRPSLITLRLSSGDPSGAAERLLRVLPDVGDAVLRGCAVTIQDSTYRLRRLPLG